MQAPRGGGSVNFLGHLLENGQRAYSPNNKPSWIDVTGKPSGILTQAVSDGKYLGKTAKAADSTKADYAFRTYVNDTRAKALTPNDLVERSVYNQFTINDNPVSGAWHTKISVKGWTDDHASWELNSKSHNSTSDGKLWFRTGLGTKWEGWDLVYTSRYKPSAADVGAYTKAETTSKYLGKTSKAADASKLNGRALTAAPTANTVALRDSAGDVNARLLRSTFPDQTDMSGGLVFRTDQGANNFLRICKNPTAILDWLKLRTKRVPDNTDLNKLETTSTWIVRAGKSKLGHCPIDYGTLEVIGDGKTSGGFVTQRATDKVDRKSVV